MHSTNKNTSDRRDPNCSNDILYYHNKILAYLKTEKAKIQVYEKLYVELCVECYNSIDMYGVLEEDRHFILSEIQNILNSLISKSKKTSKKITYKDFKTYIKQIKSIQNHISFIQNQDMIYLVNISPIVERYKQLIRIPISDNFIGKKKNSMNDEIQYIFDEFVETFQQSFPESILLDIFGDSSKPSSKKKLNTNRHVYFCDNCNEELTDSVCYNCGYSSTTVENESTEHEDTSTYDDIGRINVNKQFTYEKKCHFRDTINQYQGKQNKYISDDVYTRLNEYIEKEGLLDKKATTKIEQYRKVKKSHIKEFLKAIGYSNHYEDLQLIFSKITGKDCPSISQYEKKLYEDFDELTRAFLSLPDIQRDNFLNSHYVLRQLLLKQNVKLPQEDLNYLKTPSRLRSHDEIYKKCCNILNWNFTPMA